MECIINDLKKLADYIRSTRLPIYETAAIERLLSAALTLEDIADRMGKEVHNETENQCGE